MFITIDQKWKERIVNKLELRTALAIAALLMTFGLYNQVQAQSERWSDGSRGLQPDIGSRMRSFGLRQYWLGGDRIGNQGFMDLLTDEQRAEVQELISSMREDGVSSEEIHSAVVELLADWGIEIPEGAIRDRLRPGLQGLMSSLTDEQYAEVQQLISSMREDGASSEEIHSAVAELLASWGIEIPEGAIRGRLRPGLQGLMSSLTDEQHAEVQQLISSMRDDGATREEIHEAVIALLAEWGIEPPENSSNRDENSGRIQAYNYPNPFNPDTRITYTLNAPEQVEVSIYNVAGRLVRSFEMGYQSAGTYSVVWDGTTANGTSAPTGIYFYRIQAGNDVFSHRMLLMK